MLDHLGEDEQGSIRSRLRAAWAHTGHEEALASLRALAAEMERSHPDAAKSLREGLEETVTLQRLGASERLAKTLGSTNPIESMIEVVRRIQRNVKSWQDGDMRKRWTAAGMLEAERQFRRIIGHRDLADLAVAVEREVAAASPPSPTRYRNEHGVQDKGSALGHRPESDSRDRFAHDRTQDRIREAQRRLERQQQLDRSTQRSHDADGDMGMDIGL